MSSYLVDGNVFDQSDIVKLRSANDTSINVVGSFTTQVRCVSAIANVKFYVITNMVRPCIIGLSMCKVLIIIHETFPYPQVCSIERCEDPEVQKLREYVMGKFKFIELCFLIWVQ